MAWPSHFGGGGSTGRKGGQNFPVCWDKSAVFLLKSGLEMVSGAHGLGFQIGLVMAVGGKGVGNPFSYFDIVTFQSLDLGRVVGHQPHLVETATAQHVGGNPEKPLIGVETQLFIGLEGVEAVILKGISAEFIGQADTPAFLGKIEQNAGASFAFRHCRQCAAQLIAAIAAQRAEKIAGEAG